MTISKSVLKTFPVMMFALSAIISGCAGNNSTPNAAPAPSTEALAIDDRATIEPPCFGPSTIANMEQWVKIYSNVRVDHPRPTSPEDLAQLERIMENLVDETFNTDNTFTDPAIDECCQDVNFRTSAYCAENAIILGIGSVESPR